MESFKVGDRVRVISNGFTGTITGILNTGDVRVFIIDTSSFHTYKVVNIELNRKWYREQKLKRLLGE